MATYGMDEAKNRVDMDEFVKNEFKNVLIRSFTVTQTDGTPIELYVNDFTDKSIIIGIANTEDSGNIRYNNGAHDYGIREIYFGASTANKNVTVTFENESSTLDGETFTVYYITPDLFNL